MSGGNNNLLIISTFDKLVTQYQKEAAEEKDSGEKKKKNFKIFSLRKAIAGIKNYTEQITIDNIKGLKIAGIGAGTKKKIQEILEQGGLSELKTDTETVNQREDVRQLLRITGVGPVGAYKLLEKGVTLATLLEYRNQEMERTEDSWDWMHDDTLPWGHLNHHQRVGVFYLEDLESRIPRAEITRFSRILFPIIARVDSEIEWEICGSYRRGVEDSGDIDILMTHPDIKTREELKMGPEYLKGIVKSLTDQGILESHLTVDGHSKYMGVGRVPVEGSVEGCLGRRIDIRFVPFECYASSMLYFTGSARENIRMRNCAISKNYKLSEYGLFDEYEDRIWTESERDIYHKLGLEYVEPTDR